MKLTLYIILLFVFFINSAFANIYTIAIPKDNFYPLYNKTINKLEELGYDKGKNLKYVNLNLEQLDNKSYVEKLNKETDLILTFFDKLAILSKAKIKTPIVFFGSKELSETFLIKKHKNITGLWCESFKSTIKKVNEMVTGNKSKIGFPYEKDSNIDKISKEFIKLASETGIELDAKSFSSEDDVKHLMKYYKQNVKSVYISQPFRNKKLLNSFIEQQNSLKLPVIGKIKKDIQQGMLGGVVIDTESISKKLAEYIDKILKGRKPYQLPITTFQAHPVINLSAVSNLNIKIPRNVIKKSSILGIKPQTNKSHSIKKIKPISGNYVLGISKNNIHIINDEIINSLKLKGYIQGKNLKIAEFNLSKIDLNSKDADKLRTNLKDVDVFFITDNVVYDLIKLNLNKPVVLLGVSDVNNIPEQYADLFTGVWRTSCKKIINMAKRIFPKSKDIAMIYNDNIKVSNLIEMHLKVAKKMGINLIIKTFSNNNDIKTIMTQLKEKADIVILFPAGLDDDNIKTFVEMQNKLKLPVLSHLKHHIEMGIVAGPTVDLTNIVPKLTEYIDKIFQGRKPNQLKKFEFIPKYVINLKSAYHLDLKIPRSIIRQSEIIK